MGIYSNQRSASSASASVVPDMTEVIYLPTAQGLMPIVTQINGRIYAIHSDHLNTPRRLSTPQGQVAWQWLLSGFGEASPTTGDAGYVTGSPGATGSMPSYAPEVVFNLRYPGQQWGMAWGSCGGFDGTFCPFSALLCPTRTWDIGKKKADFLREISHLSVF